MHVLVVGAGLAGLTVAFALAQRGVRVSLVERREGPGLETSARNGSLQHPSHVEPWNAPCVLGTLLKSLGREDSPTLLRLSALPSLAGWGLQFLRRANVADHRASTLANLALAQLSLREMATLRGLGIRYHQACAGTLVLLRQRPALDAALAWARELEPQGLAFEWFTPERVAVHEPALADAVPGLVGAIHYPGDERGDPAAFCVALAAALRSQGVPLRYGQRVHRLLAVDGRVSGVVTEAGEVLTADAVVLAAASESRALARPLGLDLPIRPVKGYSITVPIPAVPAPGAARGATLAPHVAVIDPDAHVAIVPVGDDRLRVAGTAEFTGFDLVINPRRVAALDQRLRAVYPRLRAAIADAEVQPWTGLRPMCSDGRCLAGPTRLKGLWLHTGHGQLGWTVAAGSARLVADQLLGGQSRSGTKGPSRPNAPRAQLNAAPFAPARFGL